MDGVEDGLLVGTDLGWEGLFGAVDPETAERSGRNYRTVDRMVRPVLAWSR